MFTEYVMSLLQERCFVFNGLYLLNCVQHNHINPSSGQDTVINSENMHQNTEVTLQWHNRMSSSAVFRSHGICEEKFMNTDLRVNV